MENQPLFRTIFYLLRAKLSVFPKHYIDEMKTNQKKRFFLQFFLYITNKELRACFYQKCSFQSEECLLSPPFKIIILSLRLMQRQHVTAPKGPFSSVSVLLAIQMNQSMILQQMSSLIIFSLPISTVFVRRLNQLLTTDC